MTGAGSTYQRGRRHWLCVAYAFPPINRSGTHRTLGFVEQMDRLGWDATVLTATPRDESLDEELLRRIPQSTHVIRVHWTNYIERIKRLTPGVLRQYAEVGGGAGMALTEDKVTSLMGSPAGSRCHTGVEPRAGSRSHAGVETQGGRRARVDGDGGVREWVSRLLMTPDSRVGWIMPAVRAGLETIRRCRPEVIYTTSPYASAHLIGLILSRRMRLPWVADFRDPWRGNPFHYISSPAIDRWDGWLERRVVRWADELICVTPTMTEQLVRRYPFVASKCSTIMNGFDSKRITNIEPHRVAPKDHFVLTHAGQFYGSRDPGVWFDAIGRLIDKRKELAGRIHLQLIGADSFAGRSLQSLAKDAGVAGCVRILGTLDHRATLGYLAGSDALILAGTSGAGSELQVPNKLFEYLAMRKPIVATCSQRNPVAGILKQAKAHAVVCSPSDVSALADAIEGLATDQDQPCADAWSGVHRFDRAERAAELAEVFDRTAWRRRKLKVRGRKSQAKNRKSNVEDRESGVERRESKVQGRTPKHQSQTSTVAPRVVTPVDEQPVMSSVDASSPKA